MSSFITIIRDEIKKQNGKVQRANIELESAPEGHLKARQRREYTAFYQVINNKEINITSDVSLVQALIKKHINLKLVKIAERNIRTLKRALTGYQPTDFGDILKLLPQSYHKTNTLINKTARATQNKLLYDPETHKHATTAGIYVRSKSEVIIANALTSYGISFSYEEKFPGITKNGKKIYPDFKIVCSDGYIIIWEHWGLLANIDYCINQAYKLNVYNEKNYIIGENLIITMDNNNGGCNAQKIDEIIRTTILPHMGF